MRGLLAVFAGAMVYASTITPQERASHKRWMDDAQDLQEEIHGALEAKAPASATSAAAKLIGLGQQELRFCNKAGLSDARRLAEDNLDAARRIESAAKAGDLPRLKESFGLLQSSCRACHDLHPEKRLSAKGASH